MKQPLLNAEQVADRLGCSIRQAYVLMKEMQPINIGTGRKRSAMRVKPEAVDQFLESRAVRSKPEATPKRKPVILDGVLVNGKIPSTRQRRQLGLSDR